MTAGSRRRVFPIRWNEFRPGHLCQIGSDRKWQAKNERFTTAQTATAGFYAAKETTYSFFTVPTSRPVQNTPIELGDFFRKGNAGPEHQALRQMIGSLTDQQ
jgi:hypothetical protein